MSLGELAKAVPGLALCVGVAAVAWGLQQAELAASGRAWIEALVLAILAGAAVRTAWCPGATWKPGIDVSAKLLLEIAVVLLGASVSAATILSAGWALLVSIVGIVAGAILLSFTIGRLFGLRKRLAILVACGNSICGNSAIAAVAPVIGADGDDVAASIAFTAVLGVMVVLLLPILGALLAMSEVGYGALAGLTVYAVPQVIAAAAPMGATAVQVGTLVKLIRVLMLGPVCVVLSLLSGRLDDGTDATADDRPTRGRPALHQLVPWFIIGFLAMVALRSAGLIPPRALAPMAAASTAFMIISMAALGLGVDVRTVSKAGGRVTVTVILSLVALGSVSFVLVRLLGL